MFYMYSHLLPGKGTTFKFLINIFRVKFTMNYDSEVPPPPPPRAPTNRGAPTPTKIVRFDKGYVQTVPGILKLVQLVRSRVSSCLL